MRQRVAVAKETVGEEHGLRVGDPEDVGPGQTERGEVQPDLFHGRDRHPVRGVGCRVERPHHVGERAAPRDDEDRPGRGCQDRNERRGAVEKRAAELYHERAHGGVPINRAVTKSRSMRVALLLVLLLCLAPAAGAYALAEVCPDTWLSGEADEFFALSGDGPLAGIAVTDHEGTAAFPPTAVGHGRVVVARNGSAYAFVHGALPDFELQDASPAPGMLTTKDLRLGNDRDELVLLVNGIETDRVAWPGDVVPRQGQVHFREGGVWDPRVLMIGQSRFEAATVANVSGTAFVAPDCSSDVLADLVASAADSIRLNAYELTDPVLADALVAARNRGVAVTVLAQGRTVGGVPSGEWPVLGRLLEAGAEVRFMATDEDAHARYRHDHAKYIVVDDRWTLVTTENWKPAAFPPAGRQGNRGLGRRAR